MVFTTPLGRGMRIHAIVLAAGKGARFMPLTTEYHKSLFPLLGEPILDRLLNTLVPSGVKTLTVAVGWCADQIENHLRDFKSKEDLRVVPVRNYEIGPLMTFVTAIESCDATRALICPADLFAESQLIAGFIDKQESADSLVDVAVDTEAQSGTEVYTEENGRIVGLAPIGKGDYAGRSAMLLGTRKEFLDYARDALQDGCTTVAHALEHAISQGEMVRGVSVQGDWFDIDSPQTLLKCMKYLFDNVRSAGGADIFLTLGDVFEVGQQLEFPSGTIVEKDVLLRGPLYVGKKCSIRQGSDLGPYVDLEEGTTVGQDTSLETCLAFDNAALVDGAKQTEAVICGKTMLKE
ncbi:NDP-sugar synthase [Candidatus Thorarchaeota archaeon]|nr:MAG: NDP-sugar synthase [Candidatus Thorarchaeota archaeon]